MTDFTKYTNEEILKHYRKVKDQIKALEEQEAELKQAVLSRYSDNIVVYADGLQYKVQIRKIKKIKFADSVNNDRIISILKTRPEIAIEYAVALKNMGSGLASKLDIIMKNDETLVEETVYPIVQVANTETTAVTSNDDLPF